MTSRSSHRPATSLHSRRWGENRYVYPVISRRSKGLSIGVNLNPSGQCNFNCLYCQVSRKARPAPGKIDLGVLETELRWTVQEALGGRLWTQRHFATTPPEMRRLNDIAFSGDGEPTCVAGFDRAVETAAKVKGELGLDRVKLVVITNASVLDRRPFQRALPILDAHNGEIWAKLDAGTEESFAKINRPHSGTTLGGILDNIIAVARGRPVVIQTLLSRVDGSSPSPQEIAAYCDRLGEILQAGGKIKLVQLHTIARPPQSEAVETLSNAELDAVAAIVRRAVPGLPLETYYGA